MNKEKIIARLEEDRDFANRMANLLEGIDDLAYFEMSKVDAYNSAINHINLETTDPDPDYFDLGSEICGEKMKHRKPGSKRWDRYRAFYCVYIVVAITIRVYGEVNE